VVEWRLAGDMECRTGYCIRCVFFLLWVGCPLGQCIYERVLNLFQERFVLFACILGLQTQFFLYHEEDPHLTNYIEAHGEGRCTTLPKKAGLYPSPTQKKKKELLA
jgi:hypothetical protein